MLLGKCKDVFALKCFDFNEHIDDRSIPYGRKYLFLVIFLQLSYKPISPSILQPQRPETSRYNKTLYLLHCDRNRAKAG